MMSTSAFWQSGSGYEAYVGRWSRRVADVFIEGLAVPPGSRWVDVGCGTGAITQTILVRCEPASILGVDPSETFLELARSSVTDPRVSFELADGASIPLAGDSVDAAVSGLVLNFVPDPVAMLAEMRRVTRSRGTVAIYVWDYGDGMQIMRHFWEAAIEQDPRVADTAESLHFEICKPEPLRSAFRDAGLADIEVEPIDVPTVFRDFDDYWRPFLMSTAPAPRHAMSLSESDRADLRDRIRARLPIAKDGSIPLTARAWAVRATA
jgi:ubiquinone/menaquinone biosynthesis C-methylase UbiE